MELSLYLPTTPGLLNLQAYSIPQRRENLLYFKESFLHTKKPNGTHTQHPKWITNILARFSKVWSFFFGTFNIFFTFSCAINSIKHVIDGTRQLWKTSEMDQSQLQFTGQMLSIKLEHFWSNSNAFDRTLPSIKAFDWTLSIERFWLNAFNRMLSIKRFQSNAFSQTLSIYIGCPHKWQFLSLSIIKHLIFESLWPSVYT